MNNNLVKAAIAGGVTAIGGLIIKKLNDIQAEIEHFESANNIFTLKQTKQIRKNRMKEERKRMKEENGES